MNYPPELQLISFFLLLALHSAMIIAVLTVAITIMSSVIVGGLRFVLVAVPAIFQDTGERDKE